MHPTVLDEARIGSVLLLAPWWSMLLLAPWWSVLLLAPWWSELLLAPFWSGLLASSLPPLTSPTSQLSIAGGRSES